MRADAPAFTPTWMATPAAQPARAAPPEVPPPAGAVTKADDAVVPQMSMLSIGEKANRKQAAPQNNWDDAVAAPPPAASPLAVDRQQFEPPVASAPSSHQVDAAELESFFEEEIKDRKEHFNIVFIGHVDAGKAFLSSVFQNKRSHFSRQVYNSGPCSLPDRDGG